jgi:hypothetical protein
MCISGKRKITLISVNIELAGENAFNVSLYKSPAAVDDLGTPTT